MLAQFANDYFWPTWTLIIILGLVVGSFLNVVIYRLPISLQNDWKKQCRDMLELPHETSETEKFNIAFPASHCPACQHKLKFWENIPVLSFLLLRGKCSACHVHISWRYPLIELATALIFSLIFLRYGLTPLGTGYMLLASGLICLTLIDVDHLLLPDQITLPFLWLGLLFHLYYQLIPIDAAIYGVVFGYLILWSIYWLFKLLTKKEGMGYGDFKLLAMLGAWFGWQAIPLIIFISAFVGAMIGIGLIVIKQHDRNKPIPYGPYLALAGIIMIFFKDTLLGWYGF